MAKNLLVGRKDGFYWVKLEKGFDWQIMELNEGYFYPTLAPERFKPNELYEIGRKLVPPK